MSYVIVPRGWVIAGFLSVNEWLTSAFYTTLCAINVERLPQSGGYFSKGDIIYLSK